MTLLNEQLWLWTGTSGAHSHTLQREVNVTLGQWLPGRCRLMTCGCLQSKLDSWEGGIISSEVHPQRERQEYVLESTLWSDDRQEKKSSRYPDVTHKESKEPLWANSFYKPSWVDAQLTVLDGRIRGPTFNSTLQKDPSVSERLGNVSAEAVRELCEKGQLSEAVDALGVLVQSKCRVSPSLFYIVLKGCVAERNLLLGRRVHNLSVQIGYESNAFLGNHILRMYACQGRLQEAQDVFSRVVKPNAFMWFSIISAHAKQGEVKEAIQLYQEMRSSSVKLDNYVFVAALQACASAADLESGRQVHSDVLESGVPPNLFVCNSLVDMYGKCGKLEDALMVFDSMVTRDVVTWNSMIGGYAEHGLAQDALDLYERMKHEGLIPANGVTFACLLKACANAGALRQGKQLHSQILERGLLECDLVLPSCLVDMYGKCGKLEDARRVFDSMYTKNVVTWTAMIAGYAQHGFGQKALALYAKMEDEGLIMANSVTFACLLKACASAGALQQGRQLHSKIVERGLLKGHIVVGNCLIEMYAKCGRLEDARAIFDSLPTKDVVTWTAMINGYGHSNDGHKAIGCFQEMLQAGVKPSRATFTCLLVACSHEGLVNEGRQFFDTMIEHHGLMPTVEHCTCMVDLLGRAGHLDEAEKMLLSFQNNHVGLMSLMTACRSHGDIARGKRCFESLVRLDPHNASAYVLMANINADAGRWTDVHRIESLRKSAGARKKPAMAGIEVDRHVHTFVVGEERDDVSCKVRNMHLWLKEEEGHVPHTELVLKPLSEKVKEDELCGHAEKLALAYGLLNTPDGTPLFVTKNLRMCRDCHSSTERMSRIEKREISVRDSHRIHRFVGGSCSCGSRP